MLSSQQPFNKSFFHEGWNHQFLSKLSKIEMFLRVLSFMVILDAVICSAAI